MSLSAEMYTCVLEKIKLKKYYMFNYKCINRKYHFANLMTFS